MSILDDWYTSTYSITRPTTGSNDEIDSSSVVETGNCLIEQITERDQLFNQNHFGKEFALFIDTSSVIATGDTIAVDSVDYGVSFVLQANDLEDGEETHKESRIYKK